MVTGSDKSKLDLICDEIDAMIADDVANMSCEEREAFELAISNNANDQHYR